MGTLLERTLMRMGQGGLVVSIPKGWAAYYGLKPGDKVIIIANGSLRIRPKIRHGNDSQRQNKIRLIGSESRRTPNRNEQTRGCVTGDGQGSSQ